jgi:hypothetical protein
VHLRPKIPSIGFILHKIKPDNIKQTICGEYLQLRRRIIRADELAVTWQTSEIRMMVRTREVQETTAQLKDPGKKRDFKNSKSKGTASESHLCPATSQNGQTAITALKRARLDPGFLHYHQHEHADGDESEDEDENNDEETVRS